MKIRYLFVAIVLATAAACSSSPTSPEPARSSENLPVLRDSAPTDSATANRGSGWAGSGG